MGVLATAAQTCLNHCHVCVCMYVYSVSLSCVCLIGNALPSGVVVKQFKGETFIICDKKLNHRIF